MASNLTLSQKKITKSSSNLLNHKSKYSFCPLNSEPNQKMFLGKKETSKHWMNSHKSYLEITKGQQGFQLSISPTTVPGTYVLKLDEWMNGLGAHPLCFTIRSQAERRQEERGIWWNFL